MILEILTILFMLWVAVYQIVYLIRFQKAYKENADARELVYLATKCIIFLIFLCSNIIIFKQNHYFFIKG